MKNVQKYMLILAFLAISSFVQAKTRVIENTLKMPITIIINNQKHTIAAQGTLTLDVTHLRDIKILGKNGKLTSLKDTGASTMEEGAQAPLHRTGISTVTIANDSHFLAITTQEVPGIGDRIYVITKK